MGTDLVTIGNHRIAFEGKRFEELSAAIIVQLNNLKLVNAPYLRDFALQWWADTPRSIRRIKTITDWRIEEESEYFNFSIDQYLDFHGPYDLHIQIDPYKILFFDPPFRYRQWYHAENASHRNEWRKFFHQVTQLFGGDRVIYLADNTHPLDNYADKEIPFEAIERELAAVFGPSQTSFGAMAEKMDNAYLTDTLQDIDWSRTMKLDTTGIDERVSTDIDLRRYKTRPALMQLRMDDEDIRHRADAEGRMHYEHTGHWRGLMFRQWGLVDSAAPELDVWLDELAPFSFDVNVERLRSEGWSTKHQEKYALYFGDRDDYFALRGWLEGGLYEKLRWYTGNGQNGGSSNYPNGERAEYLQAASLPSLINLLRPLNDAGPYKAPILLRRIADNTTVWQTDAGAIKTTKRTK